MRPHACRTLSLFQRSLIVKTLRPDCISSIVHRLATEVFGQHFDSSRIRSLPECGEEISIGRPLMLITDAGSDAQFSVMRFAGVKGMAHMLKVRPDVPQQLFSCRVQE